MANEGHIIVKGDKERDYRNFFSSVDKKHQDDRNPIVSNKPAFLYRNRVQNLKEEIERAQKALDEGLIPGTERAKYKMQLKMRADRLKAIEDGQVKAETYLKDDPDYWEKRRETLAKYIKEQTPSKQAVKERRVNPHQILKKEKTEGDEKLGVKNFGEAKREFIVLSRILDSDSDIRALQKEK